MSIPRPTSDCLPVMVLVGLLALAAPGSDAWAISTAVTLEFEDQALDLDTGSVYDRNGDPEEGPGATGDLFRAHPEADLLLGYNADRTIHTVVFQNHKSGVQIGFIADTLFESITADDIPGLSLTTGLIDQAFRPEDTIVLRTDTGAHFKLGHPSIDTSGEAYSVTFDYERIDGLYSRNVVPDGDLETASASLPPGLTEDDWRQIRSQVQAASYRVEAASDSLVASNATHSLRANFDERGVRVAPLEPHQPRWDWKLTAVAYGYDGDLKDVDAVDPVTTGARVEYRRGDLIEWYINDARGLEHGFTLEAPPEACDDRPLVVRLASSGSLFLRAGRTASDVRLADDTGATVLRYGGLVAWDTQGRDLPARMVLEQGGLKLEVDDRGAAYPIVIDPTIIHEDAKLTASDAAAGDEFGYAVAVSGDTAVVGAYQDDDAGSASGSAYVFVRSGTTWTQQQKLTAADAAAGDYFGISVAVSGDTAVVGAYGNDDAGSYSGSAYVFVRSGTTWTEQAKLTASDAATGDIFGEWVAVSGDTVVVGAEYDGDAGSRSGSAYVFVRSGTTWTEQAKLTASDAAAGDIFGYSVAVSGDTAVVGAFGNADAGSRSGSAYVFVRNGTTWTEQAKLTASDEAAWDYFGLSVAVSGDTAVVGATDDDDAGSSSGSAYVFVRNGTTWTEQAKLTATDGAAWDQFGYSVAVSGDTAVVGAIDNDDDSGSGSAYVFVRRGTTWTEQVKLTASDGAAWDYFGVSVAVSGDTVVVGAPQNDDAGGNSGSAYVFELIIDSDDDGESDDTDNCPEYPNSEQSNVDGDAYGDLCDICPADPADACDPGGSTAEEIPADEGGTVETPDGELSLGIPPGALSEDATISVTETVFNDPEADLALSTGAGLGLRLRVYDLQPEGAAFNMPVTITIVADVSALNQNQRDKLNLYLENAAGDLEPIPGASCVVVGAEATCTAQVMHFSVYALVAPLDSDGDGIADLFDGIADVCPDAPNVIDGFLAPMVDVVPVGETVLLPDKAFKANRTIPLKLDYLCGAVPLTDQDAVTAPKIVEVWRSGDGEPLPIVDPDSGEANDSGVWFRYSGEHWIYNYSTSGLPQGTYEVRIKLPDGRTFIGGFILK